MFDIANATTISFVHNSETCTNCNKQFKEGYITDSGSPDYDLIFYCQPCAEIISNINIQVYSDGKPESSYHHYMMMWNNISFRAARDYWANNSYDMGAMEAGRVSLNDYYTQQCGVSNNEDEF
jgi:hypothetical protein